MITECFMYAAVLKATWTHINSKMFWTEFNACLQPTVHKFTNVEKK